MEDAVDAEAEVEERSRVEELALELSLAEEPLSLSEDSARFFVGAAAFLTGGATAFFC